MKRGITIGMDLGDKNHEVCVFGKEGRVMEQSSISSERSALGEFFDRYGGAVVAMETGTQSGWVSRLAESKGLTVLVGNARKLGAIWKNGRKSDERDAQMLGRMARFDRELLSPIRHRGAQAQADLELIKARDLLVRSRATLINHVRSVVKGTGERLDSCSSESFARKAKLPEAFKAALEPVIQSIEELSQKIRHYDRLIEQTAEERYPQVQRLTQVTGVGTLTALAYVLTLEDPRRFKQSRTVGAYLGLVPRRDQSGESDKQLPISKQGNVYLRRLLVGSAHYILGPFGPPCDLRRYGERLAARGGKNAKRRAIVAVARKLAVLLHALWSSDKTYEPDRLMKKVA